VIAKRDEQRWTVLIGALIAAALGGFVTLAAQVYENNQTKPGPDWRFEFGLLLDAPADIVARLLGRSTEPSKQFWDVLQLLSNTALCFSAGAILGWLISKCTGRRKGAKGHAEALRS
jgi:hypothetical protein